MIKTLGKVICISLIVALFLNCGSDSLAIEETSSSDTAAISSSSSDTPNAGDTVSSSIEPSSGANSSDDLGSSADGSSGAISSESSVESSSVEGGSGDSSSEGVSSAILSSSSTETSVGPGEDFYLYKDALLDGGKWWSENTDLDDKTGEITALFHSGWGSIVIQFIADTKDFSGYSSISFDCATTGSEKIVFKLFWGDEPKGHTAEGWPWWTNPEDGGYVELDVSNAQCNGTVIKDFSAITPAAGILDMSVVRQVTFMGDDATVTLDNIFFVGTGVVSSDDQSSAVSSSVALSSSSVVISSAASSSSSIVSSSSVASSSSVVSSSSVAVSSSAQDPAQVVPFLQLGITDGAAIIAPANASYFILTGYTTLEFDLNITDDTGTNELKFQAELPNTSKPINESLGVPTVGEWKHYSIDISGISSVTNIAKFLIFVDGVAVIQLDNVVLKGGSDTVIYDGTGTVVVGTTVFTQGAYAITMWSGNGGEVQ